MGKLNDLPFYRDIGNGCYQKCSRGKKKDIVYHEDVTGASRRRDSRKIYTAVTLLIVMLLFVLLKFCVFS
jgi:hypothetical protein